MVLSAVATTSRSSTTMNDATDASARAQRWARVTASCLLVVFTCPPDLRCDACCWLRHSGQPRNDRLVSGPAGVVTSRTRSRVRRCEDVIVTTTALARARAGDGEAFRELTDPYRRELQLHCYRILGSLQDAEDTLQETLLAAWRGLGRFEERASMRTWLYKIATNRCLNVLRDAGRRPAGSIKSEWSAPPTEPTRRTEPLWLQPYPDMLLDDLPDTTPGPEARYETREALALAFMAGLQRLPPRQRTVLVLRDVLGYPAAQAADMLAVSEVSVNSALQRARAAIGPGARAHRPVRGRVRGRRHRPPRGPPHRRRVADNAARAAGIPGSRRDRRVLPDPALVGDPVRPADAHPREPPARVRLLRRRPAHTGRAGP